MRTHTWYRKYFISYCLIAVVPVIILGLILCVSAAGNSRSLAVQQYQRSMAQIASHLDTLMGDMQQAVQRFEADADVRDLLGSADTGLRERLFSSFLNNCQQNSKVRTSVLFYFIGDKVLYTPEGVKEYGEVKRSLQEKADLDYSSFFTRIVTSSSAGSWQLSRWDGGQAVGTDLMAFTFPFPSHSISHVGTFVFLIDVNDLRTALSGYMDTPLDYLYLYNANYQPIGSLEKVRQDTDGRREILRSPVSMPLLKRLDGADFVLMRYKTDISGIQMISGVPADTLYMETAAVLSRSLILIALCTLAALAAALLLARYSYRPIRQLMSALPDTGSMDEFLAIRQHMNGMRSSIETMEERSAAVMPIVHDQLITSLLRGRTDDWLMEMLKYTYPELCSAECFFVILLSPGSGADVPHGPLYLSQAGETLYGVQLEDERLAAFIAAGRSGDDTRVPCLRELRQLIGPAQAAYTALSAGGTVADAGHITTSYLEAFVALQRQQEDAGEGIFVYRSLPKANSAAPSVQRDRETLITMYLQSLHSVDEDVALSMLHNVMDRFAQENTSFLYRHFHFVELFSRTLESVPEQITDTFRAEISDLDQFASPEAFMSIMERLTRQTCRAQSRLRRSRQLDNRRSILALLDAHCYEANFSLESLSGMAGYSATYVNRCLREETGSSFGQLVSIRRMDKARELLSQTDMMIKDITREVGYLDAASFVRKFKEAEGMTPSEYREHVKSARD